MTLGWSPSVARMGCESSGAQTAISRDSPVSMSGTRSFTPPGKAPLPTNPQDAYPTNPQAVPSTTGMARAHSLANSWIWRVDNWSPSMTCSAKRRQLRPSQLCRTKHRWSARHRRGPVCAVPFPSVESCRSGHATRVPLRSVKWREQVLRGGSLVVVVRRRACAARRRRRCGASSSASLRCGSALGDLAIEALAAVVGAHPDRGHGDQVQGGVQWQRVFCIQVRVMMLRCLYGKDANDTHD